MYARGRYAALKPLATATGNGLMTSATYDGVERPLTIKTGTASTPTSVQNLGYGWDTVSVGNLTTRDDNLNNVHEAYCYDGLHQLGLITETGATTQTKTFAYMPNITAPTDCNAVHNTSSDGTGRLGWKSDVGSYAYSGGPHQVQSVSGGPAFGGLTYDADGSTLTTPHYTSGWPGLTITWTSFDKASSESQTSTSTTLDYAYDAAHRRIQQRGVVSGTTTTFFQDGHARFEKVTTGSTTSWRDYVTGPDGTIGNAYGSGTSYALYYLHGDHQGSVTALSAGSGTSTCWAYDAWGKRRLCNGSDGPVSPSAANDRGYLDQQEIDPVELVNLNARDYDPAMGRMLSIDPAGLRAGPNPYAYSGNNPATKSDPSGLDNSGWSDDPVPSTLIQTEPYIFGCDLSPTCSQTNYYDLDPNQYYATSMPYGRGDNLGRANGFNGGNPLGTYATSAISAAAVGAPTTGSAQGKGPTPGVGSDSITGTSVVDSDANNGQPGQDSLALNRSSDPDQWLLNGLEWLGNRPGILDAFNAMADAMNFGFGTTSATGLIAPAETAAGALDEVAVTASKAPPLPEFDGTTSGLLITKEGELVPLQSGSPNPLFKNYPAAGHVEGKAAIYIRESGSSGGDVYHNNPNGTCGFCNSQIPTLLPEGSTLNVFPPPDAIPNNPWSQANPTNYTGNSNLPK